MGRTLTRRDALRGLLALGLVAPTSALFAPAQRAAAQWPPVWFWDSSPKAALKRDAVALYLFQNSASLGTDSSTRGNNLTNNNSVTATTAPPGQAAAFVGASSQSLSVASNSTLQTGAIDFAIVAWVNLTTKPSGAAIVAKWTGGSDPREYTLEYDGSSTDRFALIVRKADNSGNVSVNADAFGSPTAGVWYFVYAYHQNGVGIGISVNAGPINTAVLTTGVRTATAAFTVGAYAGGTQAYLTGAIAQPVLCKRLLTITEVRWLAGGRSLA